MMRKKTPTIRKKKDHIKTRRIDLVADKEAIKEIKSVASVLSNLSNEIVRLAIPIMYEIDTSATEKDISFNKAEEQYNARMGEGGSLQNLGYKLSSDKYPQIKSDIRTCLNSSLYRTIKRRFFEIKTNQVSIPSFIKNKFPIPFTLKKENIKLLGEKKYEIKTPFGKFETHLGKDRSNNDIILTRILTDIYQPCISSLVVKDDKLSILLTFSFNKDVVDKVERTGILGVDLGINRPIAIGMPDGRYIRQIDTGKAIAHHRRRYREQRRTIQSSMKYSKGGHGRNRKLQAMDQLREKERNFARTTNHTMSKNLIDFCVDNGVGTIKLEKLTGIISTKKAKESFMRSWSYYALQTMIEQKAAVHGIVVEYVNPKNTSITCHRCGNVDKEQRRGSKFSCMNINCDIHGRDIDSDINAAINISRQEKIEEEKPKKKKSSVVTDPVL